jgi:Virulence activator alpha C-term
VFTLTPPGREELYAFTAQPARPMAMRDELVVKVQAVDAGDATAVRAALTERRHHAQGKLALYERIAEQMLSGRSEEEHLREAERVGPYLTLMGGRMYEREVVRWCERALEALARR